MRTITENLFHRLVAQAKEAEVQGFSKVAESLTNQVEKHAGSVRDDSAFYSYNEADFKKEVTSRFWDVIVRAADFYGVRRFDANEVEELIEKTAQEMIHSFCIHSGVTHGVGAYEDRVPGETLEKSSIEVDEEDVNV